MSVSTPVELQDFRNFLYLAWQNLGLPEPTPAQYDMADALQNVVKPVLGLHVDPEFNSRFPNLCDEDGKPSMRLILEAFRGIGKSWITGGLVDWCFLWRQDINIMVVSASKKKSDGFATFCKQLIRSMPELHHLEPDTQDGMRWSNVAFDVAGSRAADQDASCYSISVMGAMTGGRADIIIGDDVEVPNTSETQGMRDKLEERVREFEAILKPGGLVIFLGTPQTEDTLYKKLEKARHSRAVWPSRMPSDEWMKYHGYALSAKYSAWREENPGLKTGFGADGTLGAPLDPVRFDDDDLTQRELRYGRTGFALQFMLDTSLSDRDRYPLKLRDLIVADVDAEVSAGRYLWSANQTTLDRELPCVGFRGDGFYRTAGTEGDPCPFQGTVMSIDPSGRGKDELAYAIVKQAFGFLFIIEVRGLKGEGYSEENLTLLAEAAKRHGVNDIVIESNFGDGMFMQVFLPVLRKIHPARVEEVRHSKQKELRIIDTLEPLLNQHRIVVDPKVIWEDRRPHPGEDTETQGMRQLFHQMTRITKERGCLKHDDRLDALAMACAYWVKAAALDGEKEVLKASDRAFFARQKELLAGRARNNNPRKERRNKGGNGLFSLFRRP